MMDNKDVLDKLLTISKLAHLNYWKWNLNTKELYLYNISDQESMRKISPLMAEEESLVQGFPEVLIEKNIVRGKAVDLIHEYELMAVHAANEAVVSFRIPFTNMEGKIIWIQFKGIMYRNDKENTVVGEGYYADISDVMDDFDTEKHETAVVDEIEKQRYLNVIKGLTMDYSTVIMINLSTEGYKVFRLDDISERMLSRKMKTNDRFPNVLEYYIQEFVIEEDRERLQFLTRPDQMRAVLREKGHYAVNYRSFREDTFVYCQVKVAFGNIGDDEVVMAFKNIDEEFRQRQSLERESRQDSLTGLLNRRAFHSDMLQDSYLGDTYSVAFLFMDLDHFKNINDTLGHAMGDQAIMDAANKLKKMFRSSDIIGRFGGDEFCVFLKNMPEDILIRKLDACLDTMRCTYTNEGKSADLSVSIGVAYYPEYSKIDTSRLIEQADAALYRAKEEGRDRYVVVKY